MFTHLSRTIQFFFALVGRGHTFCVLLRVHVQYFIIALYLASLQLQSMYSLGSTVTFNTNVYDICWEKKLKIVQMLLNWTKLIMNYNVGFT